MLKKSFLYFCIVFIFYYSFFHIVNRLTAQTTSKTNIEDMRKITVNHIKAMENKIAEFTRNLVQQELLANTTDITSLIPPKDLPKKPDYPPKPVKKNIAEQLKMGEFESEEKYQQRIKALEEEEAKNQQFEDVTWKLKVQDIDKAYEEVCRQADEIYKERLADKTAQIEAIKKNLPAQREKTKRMILHLQNKIIEEKANFETFSKHSEESPLSGICSYSQLPFFDRKSMGFSNVNVICPEFKHIIKNNNYLLQGKNITMDIHFKSLEEAEQFKKRSLNNELFVCQIIDIGKIETLVNFTESTKTFSGQGSYKVDKTDLLSQLWTMAIGKETKAPALIPKGVSPNNAEDVPPETVKTISPTSTDIAVKIEPGKTEDKPGKTEDKPGKTEDKPDKTEDKPDKTEDKPGKTEDRDQKAGEAGKPKGTGTVNEIPIHFYFGSLEDVMEGMEIMVKGELTITRLPRPVEPSLSDPSLSMNNQVLRKPGKKAGDRLSIQMEGVIYMFRWCPPGTFMMGSGNTLYEVTLTQGFWMLETEVTQEMYSSIMGNNPSIFRNNHNPVEHVTWDNCLEFCDKLTKKAGYKTKGFILPTEAQWEYACRAGTTGNYFFGNDPAMLCEYANYCDISNTDNWSWRDIQHRDGYDKTAPVGCFKPNPWGLYDMHGNVWEWCLSRFGTYPRTPQTDPIGPITGTFRIFRGGSWGIGAYECRSSARYAFIPEFRRDDIGFRICIIP